jgi:hypothetical protein
MGFKRAGSPGVVRQLCSPVTRQLQAGSYALDVEKVVIKRTLASEGIAALIEDPNEALEVFSVILQRGDHFYPDADEATKGHPRVCRIVALAES